MTGGPSRDGRLCHRAGYSSAGAAKEEGRPRRFSKVSTAGLHYHLRSGTPLSSGRLYNRSRPEHKAMESYVSDLLASADMLNKLLFIDDILIFSETEAASVQHAWLLLRRLLENSLFVKAEKC